MLTQAEEESIDELVRPAIDIVQDDGTRDHTFFDGAAFHPCAVFAGAP